MATNTLSVNQTLYVQDCIDCGVQFAVPTYFDQKRREDHKSFYCPSGHSQCYTGPTEAQREKQRADRLAQQLASREEDLRAERVSHAATRGQLTKVRNRADKGVCQHCKRSFANVQRHVAHMHPESVSS